MPGEKVTRRDFLKLAGLTVAGGALATCMPSTPAGLKPTEVAPSASPSPVGKETPPLEPTPVTLNLGVLNQPIDLSADIFTQGVGGEASMRFGDPKISVDGWSMSQLNKTLAYLGNIQKGGIFFMQPGEGKIIFQRPTGPEYANKKDSEIPFKVTLTTVPASIETPMGRMTVLSEQTKLGEVVYINEATQKIYSVNTSFELPPSYLPTAAAVWQIQPGQSTQIILRDGNGNPQLSTQKFEFVEKKLAAVSTATATKTVEASKMPTTVEQYMDLKEIQKNIDWWTKKITSAELKVIREKSYVAMVDGRLNWLYDYALKRFVAELPKENVNCLLYRGSEIGDGESRYGMGLQGVLLGGQKVYDETNNKIIGMILLGVEDPKGKREVITLGIAEERQGQYVNFPFAYFNEKIYTGSNYNTTITWREILELAKSRVGSPMEVLVYGFRTGNVKGNTLWAKTFNNGSGVVGSDLYDALVNRALGKVDSLPGSITAPLPTSASFEFFTKYPLAGGFRIRPTK